MVVEPPEIYLVRHRTENLHDVLKVLDRLPKASIVGLEMDLPPLNDPAFKKKYPYFCEAHKNAQGFFSLLKEYAELQGHQVYHVDDPKSAILGSHELLEKLEALLKRIITEKRKPTPKECKEYNGLALDFKGQQAVRNQSRSEKMAGIIKRKSEENAANQNPKHHAVIVGAIHGLQIAERLATKVREYVGLTEREARNSLEQSTWATRLLLSLFR